MKREKVSSSMITAVGYDPTAKVLEVLFKSGRVYSYQDIDPKIYDDLIEAKSKGQFVVENIVHGKYQYKELDH